VNTLKNKRVLVTGGASGIGKALAARLVREGSEVLLVDLNAEWLAAAGAELAAAGGRVRTYQLDVTDFAGIERVREAVHADGGPIDVLVNNAGIEYYRRYADYTAQQLRAVLTVNLHTPMELARLVLPKMLQRGSGHIVNIASLAGKKGVLYNGPYSASKAGIILWTDALRQELRDGPVGASVIMPGYIRDAGMFHDDGVPAPKMLGTSTPQDVADAVVEAILHDRAEVIVNPGPMRPMLALGQLSPTLADRIVEWMGVNRLNEARRRSAE
jgi:short-subunit dehydrogenase